MQFLGFKFVCRNQFRSSAAFQRPPTRVFVGQTKFQRAEQKAAETSPLLRSAAKRIVFEQVLEKRLSQIFRIVFGVSTAAQIGVNRSPVNPAQFGHSIVRARRGGCSGGDDDAPCCVGKTFVRCVGRRQHHLGMLRIKALSWQACPFLNTAETADAIRGGADGTRRPRIAPKPSFFGIASRHCYGTRVAVPTPRPVPSPGPPPVWVIQSCCAPCPMYMLKLGPPRPPNNIVPVQSAATV